MATVPRLTLLPYLQTWNPAAATLTINALTIPDGDPRAPLTDGYPTSGPAIADAQLVLTANLSTDVSQLPTLPDVAATVTLTPAMTAGRRQVFEQLDLLFNPSVPAAIALRTSDRTLGKYLPQSYRNAFAFVTPRTELAVIDDSYHCLLRCPAKTPLPAPTVPKYSWIDALGHAMREPAILRAAGLLHTLDVALPRGDLYKDGGWLFLTLDPTSAYADSVALPGFLRTFATRVPALSRASGRPVFTAVLFPVFADGAAAATAGPAYDEVFPEAIRFDDGFAKIVHATQQKGLLHLDEDGAGPPPAQDLGVQLGWDDEDVLIGQNRQIGLNPDGTEPAEAPRGVLGYRVDVRRLGNAVWHSLAAVHADHFTLGALDLGAVDGELRTEVHPRRLGEKIWIPAYYTSWTGGSLVVKGDDDKTIRGVANPSSSPYVPVGADAVPLRYGRTYEFRVRLADASGGGPEATESPHTPGERPTATLPFLRHVPPKKPRVESSVTGAGQLRVKAARPLLGYPEVVYADTPNAVARLLVIQQQNRTAASGDEQEPGLPDVDAAYLQLRVLVRPPAFDPDAVDSWLELYVTTRPFPPDPEAQLTVTGKYVDAAQLDSIDVASQQGGPGTVRGSFPIPTARDVRIELRTLCRQDAAYFAGERARLSNPVTIELHEPPAAEPKLFRPSDPTRALRSIFLRPDRAAQDLASSVVQRQSDPTPLLVQRLAQAARLTASESTLLAEPGERALFGCAGLKHRLSPENASLVLAQLAELPNRWINVVRVDLDRDWTWKGAATPLLSVTRTVQSLPGGPSETADLGTVQIIHAINEVAVAEEPQRDHTAFVFLDTVSDPLWNGFPHDLAVSYKVAATLENGQAEAVTVQTVLPVTTPPAQRPQVAAAGYALSPYQTDANYAATSTRTRMLWLEFDEPPRDPRDTYFVRVLAHAPDPLLLARAEPTADPPLFAPSPLDPELIRVITPGQADDLAGLTTMQRLIPATGSDRHFLVPLPPGVGSSSPELLGFYTYEIRVGHDRGTPASPCWSTAQGRFGEPLLLEGVQHPAPGLMCGVTRLANTVVVSAPYAQPYYDGANVLPRPPNTAIWVALYAQVHQADTATMRNIQLDLRPGTRKRSHVEPGRPRELEATTGWSAAELDALLARYGLAKDTPLSVLAVELLPEPNGPFTDPLRRDLGEVRVLRTSPLTAIEKVCC